MYFNSRENEFYEQFYTLLMQVWIWVSLLWNNLCLFVFFNLPKSLMEIYPLLQQYYFSVQFSSVPQSCPALCDPMDCSTPGLPVHHLWVNSGLDSNSCLLSRWCHPTISSSVVPVSSLLQSFSGSGSFK